MILDLYPSMYANLCNSFHMYSMRLVPSLFGSKDLLAFRVKSVLLAT